MASGDKDMDIVRQCIEMIEQETGALFPAEGSENATLEDLMQQDEESLSYNETLDQLLRKASSGDQEKPLTESLDQLIAATRATGQELLARNAREAFAAVDQSAPTGGQPACDISMSSMGASAATGALDMSLAAMLGTLCDETSPLAPRTLSDQAVAVAEALTASNSTDRQPGEAQHDAGDLQLEASTPNHNQTTGAGSVGAAEQGDVESLKRKLSMLTLGIRYLQKQIEDKSQQLNGNGVADSSHGTPDTKPSFAKDTPQGSPGTDTSTAVATVSSSTSGFRKTMEPSRRQSSADKRSLGLRIGPSKPPTVLNSGRSSGQRTTSLGAASRGSFGRTGLAAQPMSARGSLGRRARRESVAEVSHIGTPASANRRDPSPNTRRDPSPSGRRDKSPTRRDSSPPGQCRSSQPSAAAGQRDLSPNSRRQEVEARRRQSQQLDMRTSQSSPSSGAIPETRVDSGLERMFTAKSTGASSPRGRIDQGSPPPRWNCSPKSKYHDTRLNDPPPERQEQSVGRPPRGIPLEHRKGSDSPRSSLRNDGTSAGWNGRRIGGPPRSSGGREPRAASTEGPPQGPQQPYARPAATPSSTGSSSRGPLRSAPILKQGDEKNEWNDRGEEGLPFGWRNILSDAYREITGRPLVDRIQLLESSAASGRRPDAQVFWLHTMVRWCDMRLVGSERCPKRGEDLTLFVLHGWRVNCGAATPDWSEDKHGNVRRSAKETPVWNVASVQVLNSSSSASGPGLPSTDEDAEFMGRLGAILLYDALGPLLEDNECDPGVDQYEETDVVDGECPTEPPRSGSLSAPTTQAYSASGTGTWQPNVSPVPGSPPGSPPVPMRSPPMGPTRNVLNGSLSVPAPAQAASSWATGAASTGAHPVLAAPIQGPPMSPPVPNTRLTMPKLGAGILPLNGTMAPPTVAAAPHSARASL